MNATRPGMLITLEGIDGSGKSTLAKHLAHELEKLGKTVVLTKEPGASQLGKRLREILQEQPVPVTPQAEFLLFAADRAQHFNDIVIPALKENSVVVSDRMADSSLVYQGYGRGLNKELIKMVNAWVMQEIEPDLTFYLKLDAQTAASRLHARGKLTAFEQEQKQFTDKLVAGFDELFKNRQSVIILDGTLSPEILTTHARNAVQQWLSKNK